MRLVSVLTAVAAILPALTDASRLTPPVLPLIVRNPYLSTWLPNARGKPWEQWPMFWTGEHIGFSVLASLPEDRTAYPLLGRSQDSLGERGDGYNVSFPTYLGSKYDASTTNLSYVLHSHKSSKQVEITLSFLSPITPTSTVRQSIPAAYLNVFVTGDLDVDIYLDVNGQWVTGDRANEIVWDLENVPLDSKIDHGLKTWMFRRKVEQYFTETRDQSEWGTLCFSGPSDVRHEAGTSAVLRQRFSRTGTLQNSADSRFRGIMDEEPVFAFAKSFKASNAASSGPTTQSVMFTIAHIQNPVVQYAAARGLTQLRPLWSSYMPTPKELITFHYLDYDHVKELADQYATQLFKDAYNSGSDDYVDIVAVSARQVMGATHFLGTPEDPLLFMKEISSDGNTQTIDVIFPAFPFFLYTNPRWLAYLLEPLIEHMLSGQYPNDYAMHDLGASYPNATGHPDGNDEYMPVEECGNILIMGLALANSIKYGTNTSVESWQPDAGYRAFNKDGFKVFPLNTGSDAHIKYIDEPWSSSKESQHQAQKWVQRSYTLWKQWTGYLVRYGLRPHNQLSTDDFAGWLALQTNLALKGIIGIKAMSGLAEIAGKKEDVMTYENTSRVYIEKWEEYGISRDKTHAKVAYNWFGSWTTTYNLYADTLLCFHLEGSDDAKAIGMGDQKPINGHKPTQGFVPQHIYQMQSDWYFSVRQKYGLPLDSRHFYTKTDWEFFSMAVAAPRVRADILQSVAKWVNETSTDRPLTDLHDTEGTGGFPGPNFFARPVIGGHFAFLSLEKACGGKAIDGLNFLRDDVVDREALVNVAGLLELEVLEEWALNGEL